MILSCFIEVFFLEIHSSCLGDNIQCTYSNECNCKLLQVNCYYLEI